MRRPLYDTTKSHQHCQLRLFLLSAADWCPGGGGGHRALAGSPPVELQHTSYPSFVVASAHFSVQAPPPPFPHPLFATIICFGVRQAALPSVEAPTSYSVQLLKEKSLPSLQGNR